MRKKNIFCLMIIALLIISTACMNPAVSNQPVVPAQQDKNPASAQVSNEGQLQQAAQRQEEIEVTPDYPLTVTDDLGRKVTINKLPQRIVSLAPGNTEILFALGLGDRIVGVTDYCDYPEAAKTKTRVAGYSSPDLERLVSLSPDLIVAESIQEKTVLPALERLQMTVIVTEAFTINTILDDISMLGKVTGKSAAASRLRASMNSKIDYIVAKTSSLESTRRLRVLYVNWADPIWTMGNNTYLNDVIRLSGGINIYEADFEKSRAVSLESVIAKNPQVIFVSGMGSSGDAVYNGIRDEARLQNTVDAARNKRIYKISDANIIERPGPRIVEGLAEVAKMVHPEIFGELK